MKKANSIIIATIIAAFGISMFAFQPTTEAGNNVLPSATPSPRKVRKIPAPTPSPITKIKAKKPSNWSFGQNNAGSQARTQRKQTRKRSTQKRQHMPCKGQDCK